MNALQVTYAKCTKKNRKNLTDIVIVCNYSRAFLIFLLIKKSYKQQQDHSDYPSFNIHLA